MDILISVPGHTDPIRGGYDGPILYITRHYHPQVSYLLLTKEIEENEVIYGYLQKAIKAVDSKCQVKTIKTNLTEVSDYDSLAKELPPFVYEIKKNHPGARIWLNISSGTPQICGVLCMLCLADSMYMPIQINTPIHRGNRAPMFNPKEDYIEYWICTNKDHKYPILDESRVKMPSLNIFRIPMIRSQIISLIDNYDYSGSYALYQLNQDILSPYVGILLNHGRKRVNLKYSKARRILLKTNDNRVCKEFRKNLLPTRQKQVGKILEYYLSMKIKQERHELNDFVLRIEVLAEYVSIYILKDVMNISLDDITKVSKRGVYYTSQEKAEEKMPGISVYMEKYFEKSGGYRWGKEINARSMMLFLTYLIKENTKYSAQKKNVEEIEKWVKVANEVRNRAAHTMDSITESMIKDAYGIGDSKELCNGIQNILKRVLKLSEKDFELYKKLNEICKKYLI